MDSMARALARGLLHAPGDRGLQEMILGRGAGVVGPLVELLEDRELWSSDAPGGGLAPVAAATLLGKLRAVEAVEPLVDALEDVDPLDSLFSAIVFALRDIGPEVVEPVLALAFDVESFPDEFEDPDAALGACLEVLANTGRGDERVFDLLCRSVRADPVHAGDLIEFGDTRALSLLHEIAATYERDLTDDPFADQPWIELFSAIEELGGEHTPFELEMDRAISDHRSAILAKPAISSPERPPRVGRA